jgi:hypothetical protein
MICKIVRLGELMCQNYMRSIEKIKSKKSFDFTFSIDTVSTRYPLLSI